MKFSSKKWLRGDGTEINLKDILLDIQKYQINGEKIYVGTDSHERGNMLVVVTAVCLHDEKKRSGGNYFYFRESHSRIPRYDSVRKKLQLETQQSIDVATFLRNQGYKNITIHIDSSEQDKNTKSSKVTFELVSYVKGMNFGYQVKPFAWASASIADKHSK